MSTQQEIAGKGHSNTPKLFKYVLNSTDYGRKELTHVPTGWDDAELTFIRDPKFKGVLTSFSTNELEFPKEGRDYIQTAYEAKGIDYEITVSIFIQNNSTFQDEPYFVGKIDLSTYKISDIAVKVKIIPTGFQNVVLNRSDIKVDLMNEKFIGGGNGSMAQITNQWQFTSLVSYQANQSADWRFNGQKVGVSFYTHRLPMQNIFNEFEIGEVDDQTFDGATSFFTSAGGITGTLKGDIKLTATGNGLVTVNIWLYVNGIIQKTYIISGTDSLAHTFTVDENITLGAGEEMYFLASADGHNITLTYFNSYVALSTDVGEPLDAVDIPTYYWYEAWARTLQLISGNATPFYSELYGRTDSETETYAADGEFALHVLANGLWIRQFQPSLNGINMSLSNLFKTGNALHNIGLGFETISGVERARVEKESYFFNISDNPDYPATDSRPYVTNQILDFSDIVTDEIITKEVLPDWYHNEIVGGYSKFEYENIQGLKEFNTKSTWATPIASVKSQLDLTSDFRGDTQGVNKQREKPFETDPTEDVNGDKDIFIFDVKRAGLYDFTVKTNEDFITVTGGIDPDQSYNLNFTPRRNLERHGNRVTSMRLAVTDEIQWMENDKNSKLVTQKSGETPKAENDDLLVNDLTVGYWLPEGYTFEAPVNENVIAAIKENPYGVIKIAPDKYGWILEVQTNSENNKGQFELLRCNTAWTKATVNVIEPVTEIEYGYLYNWYTVDDIRELTSSDEWVVARFTPSASDGDSQILAEFLGSTSPFSNAVGYIMSDTSSVYWLFPEDNTNAVGFNARGGGFRDINGIFDDKLNSFRMWLRPENSSNPATAYTSEIVGSNGDFLYCANVVKITSKKEIGKSIRLVRTSTNLSDGESGRYTGNDGRIYRTICIGTQEWLADNLAETKYRNGDTIPTVTDNTTWSNLTTGAKCAYDNDENNVL